MWVSNDLYSNQSPNISKAFYIKICLMAEHGLSRAGNILLMAGSLLKIKARIYYLA